VERLNGERIRPTVTLATIGIPSAGPVVAAATGTVISTRTNAAYGNVVARRHSGNITTRYGHLASIDRTIRPGTSVSAGQRLGVEGSTGVSTGLHLHFQVEINGKPVDPVPFMADRGPPLNGTAVPPNPKRPAPDSVHLQDRAPSGDAGFPLPPPGRLRQDSLYNPPLPIPAKIKKLYVAAAAKYKIPWTLLAGVGDQGRRGMGERLERTCRSVGNRRSASG
jgi:hypothetical protein